MVVGLVVAAILFFRKKERLCPLGYAGRHREPYCPCVKGWEGGRCETVNKTYGCDPEKGCSKGAGGTTLAKCSQAVCKPCPNGCGDLVCDTKKGRCVCDPTVTCHGHGSCVTGKGYLCTCSNAWDVKNNCGTCMAGWSGPDCTIQSAPPTTTVSQMINGAWVSPTHVDSIAPKKIKGWVTDLMIGYYVNLDNTKDPKPVTDQTLKKYNPKVVDFINQIKDLDTEMRIWIIIFRTEWSGEIGTEAIAMAKNNKWGKLMSVIGDGMGADLMKGFSGIVVDWEKHGQHGQPTQVEKYEVQAMIDIYNQVRAVYPKYGIRINLPNYEECLEGPDKFKKSQYKDWCPDGPSDKSYHDFLGLPDAYFDFQSYGTNMDNDYGCKAQYPKDNCFGNSGDCTITKINDTLGVRLDYIKCNMCEHVDGSGGKNFLGTMTPSERAKITIGTYPTTPKGLLDIYQQVWRPYGFQGYWMFDVVYISGCDDSLLDQYRATVKQIKDNLISNPMVPGGINWNCIDGEGTNRDCDSIK